MSAIILSVTDEIGAFDGIAFSRNSANAEMSRLSLDNAIPTVNHYFDILTEMCEIIKWIDVDTIEEMCGPEFVIDQMFNGKKDILEMNGQDMLFTYLHVLNAKRMIIEIDFEMRGE